MTVRAGTGRQRKVKKGGLDDLTTMEGAPPNARDAYLAERARHLADRPCVVDGCDRPIPCPTHGTPAEDYGEWLLP